MIFLGSGATAGSGLRVDGEGLPADGSFFDSRLVQRRLATGGFPTLCLVRERPPIGQESSLFRTWNNLFIYRGLAAAGVIREEREVVTRFKRLSQHDWPAAFGYQREHYRQQFAIMRGEPIEYYLAELAIWDLRVLIPEVYGQRPDSGSVYPAFSPAMPRSPEVRAVVNLNYDTTFDDTFRGQYYHPGDGTPAGSRRWPLIRPHGSLEWTSRGEFSTYEFRWLGWRQAWTTDWPANLGYRELPGLQDRLVLYQPLIVPPPQSKEEVIGNSSSPGLANPMLKEQWMALESALNESNCWAFVGVSLASGEDHLVFLLKRALQGRRAHEIHCSCYGNHVCSVLTCQLDHEVCCHPIREGETIDKFFRRPSGAAPCGLCRDA